MCLCKIYQLINLRYYYLHLSDIHFKNQIMIPLLKYTHTHTNKLEERKSQAILFLKEIKNSNFN
jgi:hypothetical protein